MMRVAPPLGTSDSWPHTLMGLPVVWDSTMPVKDFTVRVMTREDATEILKAFRESEPFHIEV